MDSIEKPTPWYLSSGWRLLIDATVVIFAGYHAVTFAWALFTPFDYYETLPDNVQVIDAVVFDYLENTPQLQVADDERVDAVFTYELAFEPLSPSAFYAKALDSVVYLNVYDGFDYYIGSGVVLDDTGLIVTNYHVIAAAEKVAITYANEDTTHALRVVAYNEAQDIAVLQAADIGGTPAPLRPEGEVLRVGEVTYNIGHPENLLNTFTTGVITGVRDYTNSGMGTQIQISNPISAGSSGGPLFDEAGRLIGLTSWAVEYDANSVQVQSLNFALPISAVTELLENSN